MKPKAFFFLHLPPPLHGVTATNARIVDSPFFKTAMAIRVLPISYNEKITGIGRATPCKFLKTVSLLARLARTLFLFKPDFVYFSLVPTGVYFYRDALFVGLMKLFGKKIVLHLHGTGIDGHIRGPFSRWVYRKTFRNTYVILQSDALLGDFGKIKNIPKKIFIVHNALPADRPAACKTTPRGQTVFVNISTVIPAKGQIDLLRAALKLKQRGENRFRLVLCGQVFDARYEQALKNFVRENGLENEVVFRGAVFGAEKEAALDEADVFLFPSRNESFGLVALEAMRAGLPVVAAETGSLGEIVAPGAGFLYPPGDIEQLAGHMHAFIRNGAEAAAMGKRARAVFEEKFTFPIFEQRMGAIFRDVLQEVLPNAVPPRRG